MKRMLLAMKESQPDESVLAIRSMEALEKSLKENLVS